MMIAPSRRGHRMQRRARNKTRVAPMNMVSLMDIFTILVFFLLVQSSAVEVLPNTDDLTLPESVAEQRARETVLVMVTTDDILLNGQPVMSTREATEGDGGELTALRTALEGLAKRITADTETDDPADRGEVTVMADKSLPFSLIKKIMQSCIAASYGKVSFAVLSRESGTVSLGES